ncbi:MAG: hypothetical protein IPL62_12740 [Caulobacteraceae bacterium]|nr:hypothetical protein [Caulobacteraceae bacterium]
MAAASDTYNFSNYIADLFIDLGPGYSSVLAPEQLAVLDPFNEINAIGSVFNALLYQGDTRSLIENAVGGDGNDIFFGNDANNTLTGGYGSDYFVADLGADTYIGGTLPANDAAGRDLVSYEFSTTAVTINTRTGVNVGAIAVGDTYQMIDGFVGSVYNDTLVAYGYIFGYAGNDSLTGYNFEDVLDGGDGDDVWFSPAGE